MSEDYFEQLEEYREKVAKLKEYSEMINQEDAETWSLICSLFRYTDYVSDDMAEQIHKEIDFQLEKIDEWYKVIEEEDHKTLKPKH